MSQIQVVGLDLAKQVFQVHAIAADGSVLVKRQLRRSQVLTFFSKLDPCLVGLEACGGAHFWAREIAAFGHHVRLMPPAYVKPYVKRGKTDAGFDYAGPLTETTQLGNLSIRFPGKKLLWDAKNLRFTNAPEANAYLHKDYRAGWHIKGLG